MKKLITSIIMALGLFTACTNAQTTESTESTNVTVMTLDDFKAKIVDFEASQEWNSSVLSTPHAFSPKTMAYYPYTSTSSHASE